MTLRLFEELYRALEQEVRRPLGGGLFVFYLSTNSGDFKKNTTKTETAIYSDSSDLGQGCSFTRAQSKLMPWVGSPFMGGKINDF